MAKLLRYADLIILALALPIFIAAGLPIAGWATIAVVWVAIYGIELKADRATTQALAEGNRNAAMGWLGASTLARVWIIALAVLLVGVLSSKDAGLAAALLAAVLFTVHLGTRVLTRLLSGELEKGA
jgi:hypothetical protein